MKKLSVLIALALVLTIGGAYATWTYATGTIANATGSVSGIQMTAKVEGGAMGSLVITSTPQYQVDPIAGTYNPKLIVKDGSPDFVISFTPDDEASNDIKAGIPVTITLSASGFGAFDEQTVLTVNTASISVAADEWEGTGTLTYTITAANFANYLTLAEVNIDTPNKYDTYNTAISAGTINIVVSTNVTADGTIGG